MEVATTSPGMTSAIQALAEARAFWPTAPSATTAARPDGERPDGQDGAAPVSGQRATGEPFLETEEQRERGAGGASERSQDERQGERRHEQDRVDDERSGHPDPADAARPDQDAGHRDGDEDDDQPAETGAPGGRALRSEP